MNVVRRCFEWVIDIYQAVSSGVLTVSKIVKENYKMSDREKRELIDLIKGMSIEELEIVADTIPVELCIERIEDELNKARDMRESIRAMSNMI